MFFQEDDVIVEESSLSASEGELDGEMERDGSEDDIRELRARRHALAHKLAQQQKRRDKIQVSQCFSFIVHLRPTFYTSVPFNVIKLHQVFHFLILLWVEGVIYIITF